MSDSQVVNRIDTKQILKYRTDHELSHYWEIRKEFLLMYADKFEEDRLICLSNVYINMECMGMKYPPELMKIVKDLGAKLRRLEEHRATLEKEREPERPRRDPQRWR